MKKNIVIILMAIIILGLGGYLVYDKVFSKDKENNNQVQENVVSGDEYEESREEVIDVSPFMAAMINRDYISSVLIDEEEDAYLIFADTIEGRELIAKYGERYKVLSDVKSAQKVEYGNSGYETIVFVQNNGNLAAVDANPLVLGKYVIELITSFGSAQNIAEVQQDIDLTGGAGGNIVLAIDESGKRFDITSYLSESAEEQLQVTTLPEGTNTAYEVRSTLIDFFENYPEFLSQDYTNPSGINASDLILKSSLREKKKEFTLTESEANQLNSKYHFTDTRGVGFSSGLNTGVDAKAVIDYIHEATGVSYNSQYIQNDDIWIYINEYDIYTVKQGYGEPSDLTVGKNSIGVHGVMLGNGAYQFIIDNIEKSTGNQYKVTMTKCEVTNLLIYHNIQSDGDGFFPFTEETLMNNNAQEILKNVINNELTAVEKTKLNEYNSDSAGSWEIVIKVVGENEFQFVSCKEI